MKYRSAKVKAWKEKCRRGGIASGEARRAKMLLREPELRPRDPGEFIGTLELRLADEHVRRWIIRQGPRKNNVSVSLRARQVVCGFDALLRGIRPHLATITARGWDG